MECSICYEKLQQMVFILSNCQHSFHEACVKKWAEKKREEDKSTETTTCPYCRAPLDPADMEFLSPAYRRFQFQTILRPLSYDSEIEIIVNELLKDNPVQSRYERARYVVKYPRTLPRVPDRERNEWKMRVRQAHFNREMERHHAENDRRHSRGLPPLGLPRIVFDENEIEMYY